MCTNTLNYRHKTQFEAVCSGGKSEDDLPELLSEGTRFTLFIVSETIFLVNLRSHTLRKCLTLNIPMLS